MFSATMLGVELQSAQTILQQLLRMPEVLDNDEVRFQIEKVSQLLITHQRRATKSARHGFNRIRVDSKVAGADSEIFQWLNNEYLQPDRAANALLDSPNGDRKPIDRFRSRANQIKASTVMAGKVVAAQQEAILRMANEIRDSSAQQTLALLDSWNDFDIFDLDDVTGGNPILVLGIHIVYTSGISNSLSVNLTQLAGFLQEIESGYLQVPFHSRIHGADVLAAIYYFLKPNWEAQQLTALDVLSALIAAACHDFRHPGTNNSFQVAIESELALIYNERSVLESYHASEAMKILRKAEYRSCLGELTSEQRQFMRTNIIEMILSTDMSQHMNKVRVLEEFHSERATSNRLPFENNFGKRVSAFVLLQVALHTADLSNPARPLELYLRWTEKLMEEFYAQGDAELSRGLPVSPMMNREFTDIPKCQLSFIDFVVRPLFIPLADLSSAISICLEQLESNRNHWVQHILQPLPSDISEL